MHVPRRGSSPNRFLITLFTISNSPPRSRDAFSAPGVCIIASLTPIEGWAERRETFGCLRDTRWARRIASKTRVNALMTQRARRLRGALRPMTRDARLSALHRGGFGLPGPRFSHRHRLRLRFGRHPGRSQRAPRTQVVVPGGRLPCLPRRTVTSRRRRTPLPAPPSASSPETPLNERGWESSSIASDRSQEKNTD